MKRYLPILITFGVMLGVLLLLTYWKTPEKDILNNSIWRVEKITSSLPIEYTTLTLRFHNQKVSGSSECNRYKGVYEVTGNAITIKIQEWTVEGCMKPDILQQDAVFIEYLEKSTRFSYTGQDLRLFTDSGEELIDFLPLAK